MISISKNIIFQRWDALPQNLRDALCSEENSVLLRKIAQDERIPNEKFDSFSRIISYVMLGFIHAEDLSTNLQESLHLPFQTAKNIQSTLQEKIFNTYKIDLDRIYRPFSEADFNLVPDRRQEPRGPDMMKGNEQKPITIKVGDSSPLSSIKSEVPKEIKPMPRPPMAPPKISSTVPQPMVFGTRIENKPINTPKEFKVGSSIPTNTQRVPMPTPNTSRPARVELGKMDAGKNIKEALGIKDTGREPIKYSSPKNIFMPQIGVEKKPNPPLPSTPPFPPSKPNNTSIPPFPPTKK